MSHFGLALRTSPTPTLSSSSTSPSVRALMICFRFSISMAKLLTSSSPETGVIKEGFLKLYQNQGTDQEVAVLGEDTEMSTEIVITGGEVAVGVGIGMTVTDTMRGTETTVDEAGAVVPVLITTRGRYDDERRSLTPYRSRSQSPYRSRSRSPYRSIDSASPARRSPSPCKSPSPLSRRRSASSDRRSLDGQSPTSQSVSPCHRPADS